ncbi:SAM-dependent methyltransferase [Pseudomonas sp. RIT-PI-S]|uniref:SAM-dependent methyltransferase n=1 Tax=Pseudomonas sp. RIT-PI-S TaxID=3035295 RepID=UPI0021D8DFED|nr:SAM-dependent methyltransferase [Pseudomonas sp. RIT-PI-S]
MLESTQLASRFSALSHFLDDHQALWRPRPFTYLELPWERSYPQLAGWLRTRTLAQAESALQAPLELAAPAPFSTLATEAATLCNIGALPERPLTPAPARLDRDVPGRKWTQIEAFARHLRFEHAPSHWLDWCAGKGHLGRRLASEGQSLTCWEHDPALVAAGQALSEHHGLQAEHCLTDVLASGLRIPAGVTPVALHACGDLHIRLLTLALAQGCTQLAIAPCCYNRTRASLYVPLSRQGNRENPELTLEDLALPASEAVTAGTRERRQRDLSMARRLGFDLLQRRLRNSDSYLPTPSLPVSWLGRPFEDYCRHLAQLKGLPAIPPCDWASLEAQGWARLAQVRNLELPRALFRRPLELWLVLDRALWLHEQGYQVRVGTFCEAAVTPRNLMIIAERAAQQPVDNSV